MASFSKKTEICCKYHPDANLIEDHRNGDIVCPECGLVVGDRMIEVSSEWRTFSNDTETKDASRVGGPENTLLSSEGLSTSIALDKNAYDESGRLKYKTKDHGSSSDKAKRRAFKFVALYGDRLHAEQSVVTFANQTYAKMHDKGIHKGKKTELMAALCIYIAFRQDGGARSLKELSSISYVSARDLGKLFKKITKKHPEFKVDGPTTTDFLARYCGHLNVTPATEKLAQQIAENTSKKYVTGGRNPSTIQGTAIYMAGHLLGDNAPLKNIAEVTGAAESTIRQAFKDLMEKIDVLLPTDVDFVIKPHDIPPP